MSQLYLINFLDFNKFDRLNPINSLIFYKAFLGAFYNMVVEFESAFLYLLVELSPDIHWLIFFWPFYYAAYSFYVIKKINEISSKSLQIINLLKA